MVSGLAVAAKFFDQLAELLGTLTCQRLGLGTVLDALKGGEHIVDEGAKNVTDGLTVRVAN